MSSNVGIVTTTANGTVLFDSRDENLFLYSQQTLTGTAPETHLGSYAPLVGRGIIPIVTATNASGKTGHQINVVVTYPAGVPTVSITVAGTGAYEIKVVLMQSNRLRSSYAQL